MRRFLPAFILFVLVSRPASAQNGSLDAAFAEYFKADSIKERDRAAEKILATGASFQTIFERLASGRAYAAPTGAGEVRWNTLPGGAPEHATTVAVPQGYDPASRYPVRVYLHGGVARPDPADRGDPERRIPDAPSRPRRRLPFNERYFAVYPVGHADAQWWFSNQMDNFAEIVSRLKRSFNIDENRIHLIGVSDGGTGAYYAGLKNPTPWSSFYPLNGFPAVIANPAVRADGELFTTNLTNRPIYAINGENDPLYPVIAVVPWLVMLKRAGADVSFRPMAGAGHDTSWWSAEAAALDAFEASHPRNPHRASVSWETERTDRYGRCDWLVIDALDPAKGTAAFPPNNTLEIQEPLEFGLRIDSRKDDGRKIIDVIEGTPAAAMGLRKGDILMRMDDTTIRTAGDVGRAFDAHEEGTLMRFEVDRKGARVSMEAVFPPAPKPPLRKDAFPHRKAAGRVDVRRTGNTFEALTRGVGAFTILLSPTVIDFTKPVTVTVDGRTVVNASVERSAATLLRQAARDEDRTFLIGAELKIIVP